MSAKDSAIDKIGRELTSGRWSPRMHGMAAYILGLPDGDLPREVSYRELHITSDGFLLAGRSGDVGASEFIGGASDLERNWANLLEATASADGLSAEERSAAEKLYRSAVTDWRRAA